MHVGVRCKLALHCPEESKALTSRGLGDVEVDRVPGKEEASLRTSDNRSHTQNGNTA